VSALVACKMSVPKGYKALINYGKTNRRIGALLLINLAEVIPGRGHVPKKEIIDRLRGFEEVTLASLWGMLQ